MIYEPQEDSYMLEEQVKKYVYGKVLDMGTGSGIQGIAALKKNNVKSVLFADINPECVEHVKKVVKDNRAKFLVSDLFSNIHEKDICEKEEFNHKFDFIIFNPPYLPEDKFDKSINNVGGKKGYELIIRFLEQSKKYLADDGNILLLFSSLSKKSIIEKKLKEDYVYESISEKSFFMEKLYIYRIEKKKIFKGHRGLVETINYRYREKNIIKNIIAVKKYSRTEFYNAKKEANILKILNKKNIGPKLYKYDKKNNSIIIEYVNGKRIIDFMKEYDKKIIFRVLEKVLEQLTTMDNMMINKQEMTRPYKHIIVRQIIKHTDLNYEPVLIDFERAQKTDRPKNITQFIQFLNSGRLQYIFKEKNIHVNRKRLMNIAKSYNKNIKENVTKDIISCLK